MRPGAWTEYRTRNGDRDVHFFLTHDDRPKPLVVFLRGSGCAPLFVVNDDGTSSETSIFQDIVEPRRERFHFALIENPGIEPLRFAAGMSLQEKKQAFARSEDDCGGVYRANQTKSARVSDVLAVLNALAGQTWIQRTFVVGHSEGSHVATGVLHERLVDAVALFSSAGPTQFFGFHVARGASRESLIRTFADMRMLEQASDDTAYLGEPAKRWKSYALDSTPLEDVRASPVPLSVAHGGLENNLLAADLFVLEALRQQPRRPVRYVVVDRGDHAFTVDGQSRMLKLFDDFVNWADNPGRSTEALLFK
jgi:pimeloyl-ACP methyl ester carboxylesterase